ncbi:hypothetical protein GCM10022225_84460 [Plantactinospora mayteni]|uniref:HAF repeat-containing protein n=2 Tax=Plantactinospora mayteni TaxID=566021 RepID=A0ABQ4F4S3_9ACTN|nr:hypothetical protein Pma05_84490 [Plantactinospora mayteni]
MDRDEVTASAIREMGSRVLLPPTRLAVADLISAGRRLRRRRQVAVGGAGALGLALVAVVSATIVVEPRASGTDGWTAAGSGTPGATSRSCTVERLPLPAGTARFDVTAGSPSGGSLVGNAYSDSDAISRPLIWDGATVETLSMAVHSAEAVAVNDSGVVVGRGTRVGGVTFGWAHLDGRLVELPTPAGYDSAEATGINSRGEAVGIALGENRASVAVVWRVLDGRTQADRLAAPGSALAFGISDTGAVVGELEGTGAYVWDPDGRGRQLTTPSEGGRARGVRGDWVYGTVTSQTQHTAVPPVISGSESPSTATNPSPGVLWNLRTGQATEVSDGVVGAVTGTGEAVVNDAGRAKIRGADGESHPLPGLSEGGRSSATAISDNGSLIAGTATDDKGTRHPVRWRC